MWSYHAMLVISKLQITSMISLHKKMSPEIKYPKPPPALFVVNLLKWHGFWETVHFQLQLPVHGTLCRLSSKINSHWRPFGINWNCSGHSLARMLIPKPHHCQHVTILVFVSWPCNVCSRQCHFKHQRL